MIGQTISHYKITAKLGAGGMGEVYLAEDTSLQRKDALKFLPEALSRDPNTVARFKREAQAAAALNHPNIVTVYEVAEHEGRPYIAMEYVEGQTLAAYMAEKEHTLADVLELAIQIGEGLSEAHQAGIVHRDLKPGNVLVDRRTRLKIVDFGLAKVASESRLTPTDSTLGTIAYMSPEQAQGLEVDQRSDIFSLGVILYEAIAGQLPFRGDHEAAILYAIVNESPHPLARYTAHVPDEVQRIVSKSLAKDRQERYQSAADLVADLKTARREIVGSGPVSVPPTRRRARANVAIAGLAIAALLIVLTFLTPGGRRIARRLVGSKPPSETKHLAVLRFAVVGEDPTSDVFREGLLETLTSRLTQLEQFQGSLLVMPASEVRNSDVTSVREARSAFGVSHAVTGSVQYLGDQARVTVNLVDTDAERQLQSFVIDDYRADFASLQDSIVLELATMLEVELDPDLRARLTAGSTSKSAAYDLYLQGRGYIRQFERIEEIDTAIALFGRAVQIDPGYARAWTGLGDAYWHKFTKSSDPKVIDSAEQSCLHAIDLQDRLSSPHVTLGLIYKGTGRLAKAIEEFNLALGLDSLDHRAYHGLASAYETSNEMEKAETTYKEVITLRPDYWLGYRDLLFFYLSQGRRDEALPYLDEAVALIPDGFTFWNDLGALYYYLDQQDEATDLWKRSLAITPNYAAYSNLGSSYYMSQQYDEAAQMYASALDLDSSDYRVWMNMASAYYWSPGQRERALIAYRRAARMAEELRAVNPIDSDVLCNLAECYAMLDDRDRALPLVEQAVSLAPQNWDVMLRAGVVHEQLGERDTAFVWIERALTHGCPISHVEPLQELTEFRADPRFVRLRERLKREQGGNPDSTGITP